LRSLSRRNTGIPTSYHPISLLCVSFDILERLTYARVESNVAPLFTQEPVGFRHGRSMVDQVTLLTQEIKDSFSAKKNAGAVFVELTAAYDTLSHRCLTFNLLQLLPVSHMVRMIMELVGNRSFTLITGNRKRSRLRRLKNGVVLDLSWNSFTTTSTSLNCKPPCTGRMHMLTT